MGKKPSNELIKIIELTKKLTKNNIIYRRNLLRKASTYLECSEEKPYIFIQIYKIKPKK